MGLTKPSRSTLRARTQGLLQRLRAKARGNTALLRDPAALAEVALVGTLVREPLLCTEGDHPVARLALLAERPVGAAAPRSRVVRLTAWEELADQCGRELHAGDQVFVAGTLRTVLLPGTPGPSIEILLSRIELLACPSPDDQRPPSCVTRQRPCASVYAWEDR